MYTFDKMAEVAPYRDAVKWQAQVGSARMGMREMHLGPGTVKNPTAVGSVLIIYQRACRISHTVCGERRAARKFVPGDILLRPPELDWESHYHDPVEVISYGLRDDVIQSATASYGMDVGEIFGRLEARPFRSPLVAGLGAQLAQCARTGSDRLYADSLCFALIHELWRIANGDAHTSEGAPGQLSRRQIREIDEAIDAAPGGQVALERLASGMGMSMTAFAAAVKQTSGQTPYQYVLARRLEKARGMVETTTLSLAEVAYQAGFSSQSHMTDVFKAKLGVTPGKLRADLR